jgi:hypothetical protein
MSRTLYATELHKKITTSMCNVAVACLQCEVSALMGGVDLALTDLQSWGHAPSFPMLAILPDEI